MFVDRDGTLIHDSGYMGKATDIRLLPGSADAVRRLNEAGILVVVVTNQSGIARGLYTLEDFEATQRRLEALLGRAGAHLDATYVCPHHPDVDGPCECRKPGAALYRRAADEMRIDLSRSFYIGDRWRDVAVAEVVAGTPIVVKTGAAGDDAPPGIIRANDLAGAVDRILQGLDEET